MMQDYLFVQLLLRFLIFLDSWPIFHNLLNKKVKPYAAYIDKCPLKWLDWTLSLDMAVEEIMF